jgi:hypothetical protein
MLALGGCATRDLPQVEPLPIEVRENLGTIGIVTTTSRAAPEVTSPVGGGGKGAVQGAAEGAVAVFKGGLTEPHLAVLIWITAPVGALVGGVVGAAKAHSKEEVAATEIGLREALTMSQPERDLVEQVSSVAERDAPQYLIRKWPDKDDQIGRARYNSLLKLGITGPVFLNNGGIDPEVSFAITAYVTLEVSSLHRKYESCWHYESPPTSYFALGAKHPGLGVLQIAYFNAPGPQAVFTRPRPFPDDSPAALSDNRRNVETECATSQG